MDNINTGKSQVNYGVMEPETKKCLSCGWVHSVSNYYFDKTNNRYESYCKDCKGAKTKKWRNEHELENQIHQLRYEIKKLKKIIKNGNH